MTQELENLKNKALDEIAKSGTRDELEQMRIKYLGRTGEINKIMGKLPSLSLEERKKIGSAANEIKKTLEKVFEQRLAEVLQTATRAVDFTLPGIHPPVGHSHPLTQFMRRVVDVFRRMGYEVVDGPEIETEENNFDLLNVPKDHPARDAHDTFWLKTRIDADRRGQFLRESALSQRESALLLRTHTSPVQLRAMRTRKPPVRLIVPGRVFRHEATDAGHETTFYQCEGLVIDKGIRVTDLFGTLRTLLQEIFGAQVKMRVRPHYYPFVEPGFDVDMSCTICLGKGCSVCKQTGWLEMLGSGMVHPQVLRNMKVNPHGFSGFAFGLGIDRFMMLYYGVSDIRLSYSGDLRFIKQF